MFRSTNYQRNFCWLFTFHLREKNITIKIILSFWTVKKCRFNLNNHYYDYYFFIVHHLSGYCHAHMRRYGQMWCAISKHKLQVMQRNALNQNKNKKKRNNWTWTSINIHEKLPSEIILNGSWVKIKSHCLHFERATKCRII